MGQGHVYDGDGADAGIFQLTDPGSLVNDVVVTRHAAHFTDSFRPVVYRLPLGPGRDGAFTLYPVNARFDVAPPPLPDPPDLEFQVVAVDMK